MNGAGNAAAQKERESFFAAQARHRAAAWRWSAVMALVVFALALVISLLLAPLAFAVFGLLADQLNLVWPMPDPLRAVGRMLDAIDDSRAQLPIVRIALFVLLAALPGFALLLLGWRRLGRIAMAQRLDVLSGKLGLRAPRSDDLEEIQLRNLVEEMAVAAGCAAPQLWLTDHAACNLGVFGAGERAALIVTRGVLDRLDRAQTQALIGQAIAALGNGDGLLAERLLRLSLMIGLLSLLAQSPLDVKARAALRPLLRIRRSDEEVALVQGVLGDASAVTSGAVADSSGLPGWRDWLLMPLMGSLLIGVLIVPVATMLLIAPLNSLIWRRRRLLADATAVQFTRDPQALAEAYAQLVSQPSELALSLPALGDLFCLETQTASNLRVFSPYPSLAARIARLRAMGAAVDPPGVERRLPLALCLVLLPVIALVVALLGAVIVLGTWLSLALNMLFLGLPIGLLHLLLRSLAPH